MMIYFVTVDGLSQQHSITYTNNTSQNQTLNYAFIFGANGTITVANDGTWTANFPGGHPTAVISSATVLPGVPWPRTSSLTLSVMPYAAGFYNAASATIVGLNGTTSNKITNKSWLVLFGL